MLWQKKGAPIAGAPATLIGPTVQLSLPSLLRAWAGVSPDPSYRAGVVCLLERRALADAVSSGPQALSLARPQPFPKLPTPKGGGSPGPNNDGLCSQRGQLDMTVVTC